jgi:hypothetical protein
MEQPRSAQSLYERDFVEWLEQQAALLRSGRTEELDILNLIEELEALAGSHRRELRSRLIVLMMHLLKHRFQPQKRTDSWISTILEQRDGIEGLLEQSPSLKRLVPQYIDDRYPRARKRAAIETGLPLEQFPEKNPLSVSDVLTDESIFTDPVD